jgi:hypothetical protein
VEILIHTPHIEESLRSGWDFPGSRVPERRCRRRHAGSGPGGRHVT